MNGHARLVEALGGLPDNYLVIDTETNGVAVEEALVLPTQLGYLLAVDRKVEDRGAIVVNWAKILPRDMIEEFWRRCRSTERSMAENGLTCQVPISRIVAEGEDPRDAWPAYREMLLAAIGNGLKIVGHNIFGFDCPLLAKVGLQMEAEVSFPAEQLLDFGLFEKAIAAGLDFPDPAKGPIAEWYAYVKKASRRGKWNLGHCMEKYGVALPVGESHDAVYDCHCNYSLLEAIRELAVVPTAR